MTILLHKYPSQSCGGGYVPSEDELLELIAHSVNTFTIYFCMHTSGLSYAAPHQTEDLNTLVPSGCWHTHLVMADCQHRVFELCIW